MRPSAPQALAERISEVAYPGAAVHIRAVRADLRPLLTDCPMADDVILCASELAANAALHSNSRLPGGTFLIRATISPGVYVRIEVEDNGGSRAPAIAETTGHHGLDIISLLATEWGIDGEQVGRTLWAKFDWPDQP